MSEGLGHAASIIALDVVFAMATGMTGIHGFLVDAGAGVGEAWGIPPLMEHAHEVHDLHV